MPQTFAVHESFRYRSAILDQNELLGSSASMGAGVSFCSTDSFPLNRRDSMKLLNQAASTIELTNDLKYRRKSDSVKGVALSVTSTTDVDDGVERHRDRDTEIAISAKPISNHQRNAGKYTIIAFVNSSSGGGMGNTLLACLQAHLGPSFVIDLYSCRPGSMPEDTLRKYAYDPMVRVLACGGDGTCGWILSSLDKVWSSVLREGQESYQRHLHLSKYKDHLPLAIMPLGTGNDLSRQFGWGGKFKPHMKGRSMISSVERSKLTHLDTWRCIIMPMQNLEDEEKQLIPKILVENQAHGHMEEGDSPGYSLVKQGTAELLQSFLEADMSNEVSKSSRRKNTFSEPSTQIFDGSFCNYFSLGFDATVTYLFHHEREKHPEKFTSPLRNKIIYLQKSPYALRSPELRKRVKVLVNNEEGQLVELKVPKKCRAIVSVLILMIVGSSAQYMHTSQYLMYESTKYDVHDHTPNECCIHIPRLS